MKKRRRNDGERTAGGATVVVAAAVAAAAVARSPRGSGRSGSKMREIVTKKNWKPTTLEKKLPTVTKLLPKQQVVNTRVEKGKKKITLASFDQIPL